jgi:hypothetical protein
MDFTPACVRMNSVNRVQVEAQYPSRSCRVLECFHHSENLTTQNDVFRFERLCEVRPATISSHVSTQYKFGVTRRVRITQIPSHDCSIIISFVKMRRNLLSKVRNF